MGGYSSLVFPSKNIFCLNQDFVSANGLRSKLYFLHVGPVAGGCPLRGRRAILFPSRVLKPLADTQGRYPRLNHFAGDFARRKAKFSLNPGSRMAVESRHFSLGKLSP